MKKFEQAQHMRFVSVVPLERPGVIEFPAWEKTRWLGIWLKPFNVKTTIPHLIFLDCPSARQVTWRLLILEGQAEFPADPTEDWSYLGLDAWSTRRSFATLWMSQHCQAKASELKRGMLVAREVTAAPITEPPLLAPEEQEAYLP